MKGETPNFSNMIEPYKWIEYFQDLFTGPEEISEDVFYGPYGENPELILPMTEAEVIAALKHAKSGKAGGIDGLPIDAWQNAEILVPVIAKLFNALFSNTEYIDMWRIGIISTIHKKGPKDIPRNYRGITLLCAICKIFFKYPGK